MMIKKMYKHEVTVRRSPDESVRHDRVLSMLRNHFKAAQLEKYEDAIIKSLLSEGLVKYQRHPKVGEHLRAKIQHYMVTELKKRYGPYVNVLRKKDKYLCNFNMVYKTELGRLYQSCTFSDLFITSHALERYEERIPDLESFELTSGINTKFRKKWGVNPTAYDSLDGILLAVSEYGVPINQGDLLILNLTFGFLVLDVFEHFSVAKTFLSPDMNLPKCEWFIRREPIVALDATVLEDSDPIECPLSFLFKDGKWEVSGT